MERPSATFCNGKYSVLNDFCYAEFLASCSLLLSKKVELMIRQKAMQCREVRRPFDVMCQINVHKNLLITSYLFYPFRDEKELLSGFPPMYENILQK